MQLTVELLVSAYCQGYFPMPDPATDEILWFRPEPRAVLPLSGFHCSRSLRRTIRNGIFSVTYNRAFSEVIRACGAPEGKRKETWINDEIFLAYNKLHKEGFAKSVEVWDGSLLVGGVYGVSIGGAFFAESKFHRRTDASKVALYYLVERLKEKHFLLLEVQFLTPHLKSLGAIEIPDVRYQRLLRRAIRAETEFGA